MDVEARQRFFLRADRLPDSLPMWEHHVHSNYSDGAATLADTVAQGLEKGLTRLVFTEHTESDLVAGGADWFFHYAAEIRHLDALHEGRIEVRVGLEIPVEDFSGGLAVDPEMIDGSDMILGAVHAFPGGGWLHGHANAEEAVDIEFRAAMGLLNNPLVDVLAHPGGICNRYITPFPDHLFEVLVATAVREGVAIELNPAYLDQVGPYLEICRKHKALISPGSNAHAPAEMGEAIRILRQLCDGVKGL